MNYTNEPVEPSTAACCESEDDTCSAFRARRTDEAVVIGTDLAKCTEVSKKIIALAQSNGFRGRESCEIALALEEALVNAAKHGNQFDVSKRISIEFSVDPSEVRIRIKDEGPGFDVDAVADPTLPGNLLRDNGRGLLLLRTFMSGVRFVTPGNQVEIWKYRNCGKAGPRAGLSPHRRDGVRA